MSFGIKGIFLNIALYQSILRRIRFFPNQLLKLIVQLFNGLNLSGQRFLN